MSNGDSLDRGGAETLLENRSFSEVVKAQIERLPDPAKRVDPYERKSFSIPLEIPFEYSFSGNGKVRFGRQFETRQLWVDELEVTLAWNKRTARGEVLVHQFDGNGLATRTWFKGTADGNTEKTHIEGPWGLDFGMLGQGPQVRRILREDEVKILKMAVDDPLHNAESLYVLVTPTPEETAALEADRAEIQARKVELRARLDDIDEMHRRGWEESQNIWLG